MLRAARPEGRCVGGRSSGAPGFHPGPTSGQKAAQAQVPSLVPCPHCPVNPPTMSPIDRRAAGVCPRNTTPWEHAGAPQYARLGRQLPPPRGAPLGRSNANDCPAAMGHMRAPLSSLTHLDITVSVPRASKPLRHAPWDRRARQAIGASESPNEEPVSARPSRGLWSTPVRRPFG
jgi:hypothetical protein